MIHFPFMLKMNHATMYDSLLNIAQVQILSESNTPGSADFHPQRRDAVSVAFSFFDRTG